MIEMQLQRMLIVPRSLGAFCQPTLTGGASKTDDSVRSKECAAESSKAITREACRQRKLAMEFNVETKTEEREESKG